MIGEDCLIWFSGVVKGEVCMIVFWGVLEYILGEVECLLYDVLCVLTSTVKDSRVIYGGGCLEMIMFKVVEEFVVKMLGKRLLVMECFVKVLCVILIIICDNGGLDSFEFVS